MVSIWWVVCAFFLGGFAGLAIFAFMNMAAAQNERFAKADEAIERHGLGKVKLGDHWT